MDTLNDRHRDTVRNIDEVSENYNKSHGVVKKYYEEKLSMLKDELAAIENACPFCDCDSCDLCDCSTTKCLCNHCQ